MKTPKLRRNGDGREFTVYPGSRGQREYFGKFGTAEAASAYQTWLNTLLTVGHTGRTIQSLCEAFLIWAEEDTGHPT